MNLPANNLLKNKSFSWSGLTLVAIFLFSSIYTISSKKDTNSWQAINSSDGIGYYAYLPATFIYHDVTYKFIDSLSGNYPKLAYASNCGFCNLFDGKGVNKYFAGEAVLLTPFFLVAHVASGSKENPSDGYSYFYMIAIVFAAVCYLMLGLWSTRNLLRRFGIKDGIIVLVLLCIFLGSNLYYYAIHAPLMTHVYSFGLISFFFLQLHILFEKYSAKRVILLSILLALIMLVRPINILVLLALPFFAGSWSSLKSFFSELFRHPVTIITALLIYFAIIFIQPLYYYLQCGHWLVYAYNDEVFNFAHPMFFSCLFSYSNGFFLYAPVLFVAVFGMFTFLPKQIFRFVSFLILFCAIVWVISSWGAWTYGGAFGMRPLVEYISLFALMFGVLLEKFSLKRFLLPFFSLFLLLPLVFLCQFQTWQFRYGLIAFDHMTKENYWMVFLETREQFLFINQSVSPHPLPPQLNLLYTKTIDFETADGTYDSRSVIKGKAFSGEHSACLKEGNNHFPYIKIRLGDYFSDSLCKSGTLWVNASCNCMLEDNGSEARLNVVVKRGGSFPVFVHQYLIHQVREENKWGNCVLNLNLPPLDVNDTLIVNPERNLWFPVYIDDLRMNIYEQN